MVEGTCLENKQAERSRGFKSYILRQKQPSLGRHLPRGSFYMSKRPAPKRPLLEHSALKRPVSERP